MAKSEWSYKSAVEMSAALTAKKVSAVELTQDAIDRIERHDGKVNAICVRDFDRALSAARDADALLGQQSRQRGAQAFAGTDDEGDLVFRVFHEVISRRREAVDLGIRRADNQPERAQFRRANCSFTAIMPP